VGILISIDSDDSANVQASSAMLPNGNLIFKRASIHLRKILAHVVK